MKITFRRMTYRELFSYISFSIFLIFSLLSSTFFYRYFDKSFKYIILFALVMLFLRSSIESYTVKTFFAVVLTFMLIAIGVVVSRGIGQLLLPVSIIYIYSFKNISFSKISNLAFWISLAVLVFVIISSQLGIVDDYITLSSGRVRHFLGFRYALFSSVIATNLTMIWAYKRRYKVWMVELFLALFLNYWIYSQTDSRLTFLTTVFIILLSLVLKWFPNILDNIKKFLVILIPFFPLSFFASYHLTANYNPFVDWQYNLNAFLGTRLSLGYSSLKEYGFSWFGQPIHWVGNGLDAYGNASTSTYTYVDSFYIQILQRYGIIFVIIVLAILTLLMYKLYIRKEYYLLILLATIAVHGMIDDLILHLYYNTFWFLLGLVVYKDYSIEEFHNVKDEKEFPLHP